MSYVVAKFASTYNVMGVAHIIMMTTMMAIITTIMITTTSEVHEDVTDTMETEAMTISLVVDAAQAAENARDATRAMTAGQVRLKRHSCKAMTITVMGRAAAMGTHIKQIRCRKMHT